MKRRLLAATVAALFIFGATSENLIVTSALAGKYAYLRVGMVQAGYERTWVSSNVIKLSAR